MSAEQRANWAKHKSRIDSGIRVVRQGGMVRAKIKRQEDTFLPCDLRGERIGKLVCNCSGAAVVYGCSHQLVVSRNGYCIPNKPSKWMDGPLRKDDGSVSDERYIPWPGTNGQERADGIMLCESCPHRCVAEKYVAPKVWRPQPSWDDSLRFIRNQDLANDTMDLIPQIPHDLAGVIGIPVSGMIPAALLSRMLCLPLYSFDTKEGVVSVGDGRRSRSVHGGDGKYLVVDDTVYTGGEMRRTQQAMKKAGLDCIYAVVYTKTPQATDLYSVHAPGSIILEWNIFNSGSLSGRSLMPELKGGICTDFDGVICEEPPVSDVRNPEEFMWWLQNARPQYLPRKFDIPLIVSFRIEPWREITMEWMKKWGVRARSLRLHPAQTIRERHEDKDRVATHKAEIFKQSQCSLMFESDPKQAEQIADESDKTVIVPTTGQVFNKKAPVQHQIEHPAPVARTYHPIEVRNLIYHVCPLSSNSAWIENVSAVKRRIDVFNGKRIVVVATGIGTESLDVVKGVFGDTGCTFIEAANDRRIREAATFRMLLDQIRSTFNNEATFYAHTKGVATGEDMMRVLGAKRWRNAMYHHLLDKQAIVMKALEQFVCVGTTQIGSNDNHQWKWVSGMVRGTWHFAGTFFWFRHDAIFGSPAWSDIANDRYAVEAWLGTFIDRSDACSVYQPWDVDSCDFGKLYDPRTYGAEYDE